MFKFHYKYSVKYNYELSKKLSYNHQPAILFINKYFLIYFILIVCTLLTCSRTLFGSSQIDTLKFENFSENKFFKDSICFLKDSIIIFDTTTGKVKLSCEIRNGLLNGLYKEYYNNGKLKTEGYYSSFNLNDTLIIKRVNQWSNYDSLGVLKSEYGWGNLYRKKKVVNYIYLEENIETVICEFYWLINKRKTYKHNAIVDEQFVGEGVEFIKDDLLNYWNVSSKNNKPILFLE